jgi:hypothetical protein
LPASLQATLHQYRFVAVKNRAVFCVPAVPVATSRLAPTASAVRRIAVKQVCFVTDSPPLRAPERGAFAPLAAGTARGAKGLRKRGGPKGSRIETQVASEAAPSLVPSQGFGCRKGRENLTSILARSHSFRWWVPNHVFWSLANVSEGCRCKGTSILRAKVEALRRKAPANLAKLLDVMFEGSGLNAELCQRASQRSETGQTR